MATATSRDVKDFVYEWEGKDRNGKQVRGELRAAGENQVQASLRRQGVFPTKIKKPENQTQGSGHLYPAVGNHDEGGRSAVAVV